MLCSICAGIHFRNAYAQPDERLPNWYYLFRSQNVAADIHGTFYSYSHQTSVEALRAAASKGCHLCALLLDNFKHSIFGDRNRPPWILPESAVEIRWYPDVGYGTGNERATYRCLAAFLVTNPSLFQVPFHFTQYEGRALLVLHFAPSPL